jgi:hypothetical protein
MWLLFFAIMAIQVLCILKASFRSRSTERKVPRLRGRDAPTPLGMTSSKSTKDVMSIAVLGESPVGVFDKVRASALTYVACTYSIAGNLFIEGHIHDQVI